MEFKPKKVLKKIIGEAEYLYNCIVCMEDFISPFVFRGKVPKCIKCYRDMNHPDKPTKIPG